MLLHNLIQDLPVLQLHGDLEREVLAITYHSGQASEGSLFVAIKGTQSDGHDFVQQAIDRGCLLVVVEEPLDPIPGVVCRPSEDRPDRWFDAFPGRGPVD